MNDQPRPRFTGRDVTKLVVGVVVFAILIAVRTEFEQRWVRAAMAGVAAAVLAVTIAHVLKRRA